MEHPPYSLDLAPNDFRILKTVKKKKSHDGTGSSSTTGVPNIFQTVAASLGYVHSC
jgi:hypothetical protein